MKNNLKIAINAAQKAGKLLKENFNTVVKINSSKGKVITNG